MPSGIETFVKAIEQIFLSPRVAATVFLVSVALVFGAHLVPGVSPLAQHYRPWIWVLLLLSGFYTLTFPTQWGYRAANARLQFYRGRRECIERLHSLTTREKHILQWHVEAENGVESWSVRRMEINALVHDRLLMAIQQVGGIGYFKMPTGVRKYLLKNPELISTPNEPRPPRSKNEWMI